MIGNNTKIIATLIILISISAFADERVRSNIITYVILAVLAVVGMIMNNPMPTSSKSMTPTTNKPTKAKDGTIELKGKEKKYIIFYLLTQLEKKEFIDMKEITSELNVSIYELNDLVRLLAKHGAIELVYPPLQNFPLIRKGDPEKSKRYREGIFHELARKTLLGEEMLDDFAREVSDYLQSMKKET